MNVLSLFDGMSCGQIALNRIGIKPNKYYASEIDKHAIKVTQTNFPNTLQLGDVTKWREWDIDWSSIDLLTGGSPCQGFSFAGKQLNFDDARSKLFFTYVEVLANIKSVNPNIKFMLENVKMKKEHLDVISDYLGVQPTLINSALVSVQNRQRYYWANWDITPPTDLKISFQDIKENDFEICKLYKLNKTKSREKMWSNGQGDNSKFSCANVTNKDKVYTLTTKQDRCPNSGLVEFEDFCRFLTREELEQCQNVPKGYTSSLSYNQACKCLGNGWTVDVIAHIFKQGLLAKQEESEQ